MNLHRFAALKVAALDGADRAWILDRLASDKRALLQANLQEISSLAGGDMRVVGELPPRRAEPSPMSREAGPASGVRELREYTLREVRPILDELPLEFVALVMDRMEWGWASVYVSGLDAQRRELLPQALHAARKTYSESFVQLLIRHLEERLQVSAGRQSKVTGSRFEQVLGNLPAEVPSQQPIPSL